MAHLSAGAARGAIGRPSSSSRASSSASAPALALVAPRPALLARPAQAKRAPIAARAAPDATVIDDVEAAPAPAALPSSAAAGAAASPDAVKLRLRLRSYDKGLLARACRDVTAIAAVSGAKVAGPVHLPTKRRIYCVLRSPHVDKDSREHFEIRTHNRLIDLSNLSAQTLSALMEYVPPSGIELQTKLC